MQYGANIGALFGSARTTCNSSQTVTATAITEGFSGTIATTGSTGSAYGFAATSGYRNDGDAGLTHVIYDRIGVQNALAPSCLRIASSGTLLTAGPMYLIS